MRASMARGGSRLVIWLPSSSERMVGSRRARPTSWLGNEATARSANGLGAWMVSCGARASWALGRVPGCVADLACDEGARSRSMEINQWENPTRREPMGLHAGLSCRRDPICNFNGEGDRMGTWTWAKGEARYARLGSAWRSAVEAW
ncbi:hypothetical protein SCHPADRAFT_886146 [Schizopora paradoxa]|uniref:Uncharacterized protein n=1 Tax=Schizopora paradoxa TaxID=27342 RepID=A0A0H2S3N3_9AGAM|nr:hypothetical protein SCHPADRAFT_886146 [Schizopora paradoxa]